MGGVASSLPAVGSFVDVMDNKTKQWCVGEVVQTKKKTMTIVYQNSLRLLFE
jgi:hypothetical protein